MEVVTAASLSTLLTGGVTRAVVTPCSSFRAQVHMGDGVAPLAMGV